MNVLTSGIIEKLRSRSTYLVWSLSLLVCVWLNSLLCIPCRAGLIVYIDDASTLGIDVVIADGKKANETIEWVTSDKELVVLKTTLSDSDVSGADGIIGLSTEKDGGTWALLKSFLPNFTFDPGFVAAETRDPTTGSQGLAMKMDVLAEKGKSDVGGNLQIWASRTYKNPVEIGTLRVEGSGHASESMMKSPFFFTGAVDAHGNEFATSNSVTGSPTFGSVHNGLASYEFSRQLAVSLRSSTLMSMTAGLSVMLKPGETFSSGVQLNAVVPEPGSIVVWSLATGGLLLWRRRIRR